MATRNQGLSGGKQSPPALAVGAKFHELPRWLAMQNDPVVVVAHGAIGRCLIGHLTNLDRRGLVSLRMPQGKYCRIEDGRAEWFDAMSIAA